MTTYREIIEDQAKRAMEYKPIWMSVCAPRYKIKVKCRCNEEMINLLDLKLSFALILVILMEVVIISNLL